MKKLLSLILTLCLCLSAVSALAVFSDIDSDTLSWAGEAIDYLDENSVINGYGDGTFRPLNNVTRAEYAKMLSLSFALSRGEFGYDDIKGHWAEGYILDSLPMLLVDDNNFRPDENASREFIAYGLVKALGLEAKNTDALGAFSDNGEITALAKDELAAAVENGIIKGYEDNSLRPQADVTRAEAATLIYRAIKLKDSTSEPDTEQAPDESDKPEIPDEEIEDISSLYPGKNLILISGVATTNDNGDMAYRLSYYLADGKEEYTTIISDDVRVEGVRTSVSELRSGDVMVMDTLFHGRIACLHVLASFDGSTPTFGEYSGYSRGDDYTLEYGRVTAMRKGSKYTVIKIENDGTTKDINVLNDLSAYVYAPWRNSGKWSYEDLGAIDYENEDVYVYVRYTNGLSTDVIISDIAR